MCTSRQIFFAGLIGFSLTTAGCRPATPPQQHSDITPYVHADPTKPPSPVQPTPDFQVPGSETPPAPGSAQALAQRAMTYAQSLEPVTRKQSPTLAPTPAPAPAHSDWPDPDAMRLTPQPDPTIPSPAAGTSAPLSNANSAAANASIALSTTHTLIAQDARETTRTPAPSPAADGLGLRFAQRARDYPSDLAAQTDDQMLRFLGDEPVPNLAAISGLAAEDRELLSALMDSLTNFRTQLRGDNNMLFSKKIRPLIELADRLHAQAELSVPTVALCTNVAAFGVYDPMEPARFVAGKPDRYALVYCEVENFLSQLNEKKLYETRLTEDIVLYNEASGALMWSDKRSVYIDQSRTRRHDFFMVKRIAIPARLNIDRYLLKVTVEDQQAKHIAENTIPVEIVAQ